MSAAVVNLKLTALRQSGPWHWHCKSRSEGCRALAHSDGGRAQGARVDCANAGVTRAVPVSESLSGY